MSSNAPEEKDRQWMERALNLAQRSIGLSSPNPAVGCVLVQGDQIAGEGFHEYDKRDHAEIVALKQAGGRARGATAYVTLEPCSHQGRTGPCADALLAAGVARVVVATRDPNPLVHGAGIERLRAAGVAVETGLLATAARRLNDAFARYVRTSLPFVTLKIASSLDGRIAPAPAPAKPPLWITGAAARDEVQKMRHAADAILTGVGTVLADDPLLTDRSNLPRRRRLLRVVLDSTLRTPLGSQLVTTAQDDLLIFFNRADDSTQEALEARGVRLARLGEGTEGLVPLDQAMKHLGAMGLLSVLIEGGSEINAAVLNESLADRLVLFYAPTLLGSDAVPMAASKIRQQTIQNFTLKRLGEDFALDARLRDPWMGVD